MNRLQQIEERYLGQGIQEFLATGGDTKEYAQQVFARQIFGADESPAAPDLGINTVDDLTEALDELAAQAK